LAARSRALCALVFLPGAGGGSPDLSVFGGPGEDSSQFQVISYPGWQRYTANGFSCEILVDELAAQIAAKVPEGPIRIVGLSIGGHFGYAVALRLQAMGREIAGLCAIDTFMFTCAGPSEGWQRRALAEAMELLRARRMGEFIRFVQSRFWRALLRLASGRLPKLFSSSSEAPMDPVLEGELSMRLLVREAAPWLAALDCEPQVLHAPAILLRTQSNASSDAPWRRRCPEIGIYEVPGKHHTLFEPENAVCLHDTFLAATRDWC
jgi:thioesterase domain-containing protein